VELDVSGVNGELVLLDVTGYIPVDGSVTPLFHLFPESTLGWGAVQSRFEHANWLGGPVDFTPLENMRLGGLSLDGVVLLRESFFAHVGLVGIFHPVDREKITKAGFDRNSINLVVW